MKIKGTTMGDTLIGTGGDDVIRGGRGNDWINGKDGADLLFGGKGKDLFLLDVGQTIDVIADYQPGRDTIVIDASSSPFPEPRPGGDETDYDRPFLIYDGEPVAMIVGSRGVLDEDILIW